jgi:hypothetical protein
LSRQPCSMTTTDTYNTILASRASGSEDTEWLQSALQNNITSRTRTLLIADDQRRSAPFNPQMLLNDCGTFDGSFAICIIENIGPQWIEALGTAWSLEPDFFLQHARMPDRNASWNDVFHPMADPGNLPYAHISGVFEYNGWASKTGRPPDSSLNFMKRHVWQAKSPFPISSHTCISYYRVKPNLCATSNS